MGIPKRPQKVKLIAGLLSGSSEAMKKAEDMLRRSFGPTDLESEVLDFTHSDYYAKEMGSGLKRKFLSFRRLFGLRDIYKVKVKTNALEKALSAAGKRTVNIDPGYVDHAKLVLFSTKDYTHRIHLHKSIFAEVTLFYKGDGFNAWPWTYPDYKSAAYIRIFNAIREIYAGKRCPCP